MEPYEFSLTTETREGRTVIIVRGDLDELSAPSLDEELDHADEPAIVDLTGVTYMSSAGLHVLLNGRQPKPAIVCPTGNVSRVLDIVAARRMIAIFPDLSSALVSLSAAAGAISTEAPRPRRLFGRTK